MYHIIIQDCVEDSIFTPSAATIKQWAKTALRHKTRRGELTIRLVNKQEIQNLNKTYRQKAGPTNVLSFPADLPEKVKMKLPLLGDIVICPAIVNEEAKKQNKTYQAHWAHIIIHGALHIVGYDHELPEDAERMEAKEIKLLKSLGFSNPYYLNEQEMS